MTENKNPFLKPYNTPHDTAPFHLIKIEHYEPALLEGMKEQNEEIDAIVNNRSDTVNIQEKGNQKEQFKIPKEKISRFFAPGTPTQKIEDTIVKALELYRKRQRSLER